jgi:hypothetical protein
MILEVRVKNQGILENDIQEYERTRQMLESQNINLKEKV